MEKSMLIIGTGIAGLSAGCYGQMNGYKTQLFEMHDKPGGVCTCGSCIGKECDSDYLQAGYAYFQFVFDKTPIHGRPNRYNLRQKMTFTILATGAENG
jgi:phytoene dehydrogenase-like protein